MERDLERLFRLEASELIEGLSQGLLSLEKQGDQPDLVAHCYRLAHTLKGASRAVRRTDLSEMAHMMEETLGPYRQSGDPVEADCSSDLLKILELIRAELSQPAASATSMPITAAPFASFGDHIETVRVELSDMDQLLSSLAEVRAQLRGLHELHERLLRTPHGRATVEELRDAMMHVQHDFGTRLGRAEQELIQSYERVSTLRLVPVSVLFPQLELAARDAAQLLNKQVSLTCEGGDIRIEANILSVVRVALLHMVRNAVDHGIEAAEKRVQAGKDPVGRVHIIAERRGRRVAFICFDDGGGIDVNAVREAALAARVLDPQELAALRSDEVLQLIFRAGVTTRSAVTEVSGRGVGLDIVRETAARLSGEVTVSSTLGTGSSLAIIVPTSLSSLSGLLVSVSGSQVLLPMSAVCGAQRISSADLITRPGGESLLYEGSAIPFVSLAALLEKTVAQRDRWSVVIMRFGPDLLALGTDRLEGTLDVVVKPLPAAAGSIPLVAGAALDVHSDPLLLLDLRGVFAAQKLGISVPRPPAAPPKLPILIIDDSLTTRTLEQSVLEVAGYRVDLASSGEEGLSKARAQRYGLFIVDIEMPGMNGIEFTERTRADPTLLHVPVMLVTSLSTPEHRRLGREAGAAAYIVKSEFNQGLFLSRVAELLLRGS